MGGNTEAEGGRLQVDKIPTTPASEKVTRTSVQLPDELWEELGQAAKVLSEVARKEGRRTFARDDVIAHACKWWLQAWKTENAKKPKG